MRALEKLKNEWPAINAVYYSRPGGEIDGLKMDFIVYLRSRLIFPLQVKAWPGEAKKHRSKYPHIDVIVVYTSDRISRVAKRIRRIIERRCRQTCAIAAHK